MNAYSYLSPTKGLSWLYEKFWKLQNNLWKVFENYLIYILFWVVTILVVQISDSLNIARLQNATCVCMF
jgi:hypothetical protein